MKHGRAVLTGAIVSDARFDIMQSKPIECCQWCSTAAIPDWNHLAWHCTGFRATRQGLRVPHDNLQRVLGWPLEAQTINWSCDIWQVCANACWIDGIALCSDILLGASVVWPVRLCKLCPLWRPSLWWLGSDLGRRPVWGWGASILAGCQIETPLLCTFRNDAVLVPQYFRRRIRLQGLAFGHPALALTFWQWLEALPLKQKTAADEPDCSDSWLPSKTPKSSKTWKCPWND